MSRPVIEYNNESVMLWVKPFWVAGCKAGYHKPSPITLHHAIDDAIIGASQLGASGYVGQSKLCASKLMIILATLPVISVAEILRILGRKKDAVIMKGKGFSERQAQNYAVAARVASRTIEDYMASHPEEVMPDLERINEPIYKADIPE